jgi:hypothetical protein
MVDYITELISLIVGSLIGFFFSWYYFKKSETSSSWLANNLENVYLSGKFPEIFQNIKAFHKSYLNEAPRNKDIPHLMEIRCETNKVYPNSNFFLLFRLIDLGLNLLYAKGIEIRNNLNNYNIPVYKESFGWYHCNVNIPIDAPVGNHKLIFILKDSKDNKNTQEFEYTVLDK